MFNIIIKETKEFLRDKTNLFFFMAFPIILVFLLGNLLENMDKAEEGIGEIKVQYLINTSDPYQQMAINSFIQSAGTEGVLVFSETKDLNTARGLAAKDEITAVVVFEGEPLEISVYEGSNRIKNKAVGTILETFIQSNKAIRAVMEHNPAVLADLNIANLDAIEQKDLGVNRTMIDYYAVAMVAMISFMSMLVGAVAFVGERQNKTINRLIAAPQNRVILFLQTILGMVPQVVLQISLIMVVIVFLFKANYATSIWNNLYLFLLFLVVTLCMISLGAVLGIVIKINPTAVIMPVLWVMMFFGGTYSKEIMIPGLTNAMPIYQIQQAAFDLAIFGRYEKGNTVIIICLAIMTAALALGAILFSRKEEER